MDLERNEEGIGLAKAKKLLWLKEDQSLLIRTKTAAKPREEHRAYFCTLNRLTDVGSGLCFLKKKRKKKKKKKVKKHLSFFLVLGKSFGNPGISS